MRYLADYNYVTGIGITGECLPSDKNYIALSDEKDSRGMAKPLFRLSYGANERAIVEHATKLMSKAWDEEGAHDTWVCTRSAHTIGTCRMGTSP